MTPDNLPFLGQHPVLDGVFVIPAIWVTHAPGSAAALATAMTDGPGLPVELAINRFGGIDPEALRLYRDIYATEAV